MSYIVYWTIGGLPRSESFDDIASMLECTSSLRKLAVDTNNAIHHIVSCADDPNCTSLCGADEVKPGYDWKKRRK
jgi:hypothetical protein